MVSTVSHRARTVAESIGLTRDEVARIVGASPRTVSRWWSGASTPQPSRQARLRELAYVTEELGRVLEPEQAREWLFSPNRRLEHDSPADRIARGDYRTVLAIIEAMADGVVF